MEENIQSEQRGTFNNSNIETRNFVSGRKHSESEVSDEREFVTVTVTVDPLEFVECITNIKKEIQNEDSNISDQNCLPSRADNITNQTQNIDCLVKQKFIAEYQNLDDGVIEEVVRNHCPEGQNIHKNEDIRNVANRGQCQQFVGNLLRGGPNYPPPNQFGCLNQYTNDCLQQSLVVDRRRNLTQVEKRSEGGDSKTCSSNNNNSEGGGGDYKCGRCTKAFNSPYKLKIHQRVHTNEKPYMCKICGKCFKHSSAVKVHERGHSGDRPHKCEFCDRTFLTVSNLKIHERIHTDEKPYSCSVCQKMFNHASNLKIHERIHTGAKPYNCGVCGKAFVTSSDVKVHMRLHTGDKPFDCEICGKSFVTTSHLKSHSKVHTGEKPFHCYFCNKAFSRITNLKVHQRIHTGERPYSCSMCGKTFTHISNMKIHEKIHVIHHHHTF